MVKLLPLLPRPRSVTTIGSGVMLTVGSRMVNPVIIVGALCVCPLLKRPSSKARY